MHEKPECNPRQLHLSVLGFDSADGQTVRQHNADEKNNSQRHSPALGGMINPHCKPACLLVS